MQKNAVVFILCTMFCVCLALDEVEEDLNFDDQDLSDRYTESTRLTHSRGRWIGQIQPWWIRRRHELRKKQNDLVEYGSIPVSVKKQERRRGVTSGRKRTVVGLKKKWKRKQRGKYDAAKPWEDRSNKKPQHIRIRIRLRGQPRSSSKKKGKKSKKFRKIVTREINEDEKIKSAEEHFLRGDKDDELLSEFFQDAVQIYHSTDHVSSNLYFKYNRRLPRTTIKRTRRY